MVGQSSGIHSLVRKRENRGAAAVMYGASCLLLLLLVMMIAQPITGSNQLHRPVKDKIFWNPARILAQEPSLGTAWPEDAVKSVYLGKWSYHYRRAGMQTSTDDHIVSLLAIYPNLDVKGSSISLGQKHQQPALYVDLGCGIGSSLLTVAHELEPIQSLGIEAQAQSFTLLQRTLDELPPHERSIACIHKDLRELTFADVAPGTCDLVTANPPYARLEEGTLPKDPQRRSARFELRGGLEDYVFQASKMLKTDDGRFVLSFWNRDDKRVEAAAAAAGLVVHRKIEILMGVTGSNVYEMRHRQPHHIQQQTSIQQLDITRDSLGGGGLHQNYLTVKTALNLAPRPLKDKSLKNIEL